MAGNLDQIVDQLSTLSVLEAAELVKKLEEKWGVSAAAPVAMAAMPGAGRNGRRQGSDRCWQGRCHGSQEEARRSRRVCRTRLISLKLAKRRSFKDRLFR
jgi:hypothetical protein